LYILADMKKYALITGGSKGLGKAIALKFAQNKINIGISGRDILLT